MNEQYIGIIEINIGHYYTILKDDNGYKAVSPTNNGYFTIVTGYQDLGPLYNQLYLMFGNLED